MSRAFVAGVATVAPICAFLLSLDHVLGVVAHTYSKGAERRRPPYRRVP